MKKILFATTALVMTAGAAAAEVTLAADARMGVIFNGEDWNFTSRIRTQFNMSGETDGGLTFGAAFRVNDEGGSVVNFAGDPANLANQGAYASNGGRGTVFIAGAFGRLAMGRPAGAAEAAVGDLLQTSLTGLGFNNEFRYIQGDGVDAGAWNPTVLYTYTFGDFTFHASANDGFESGGLVGQGSATGATDTDNNYAVGGRFGFGDFAITAGFESSDLQGGPTARHYILGAEAVFGDIAIKAAYGESDNLFDYRQYGVSVAAGFDLLTVTGWVREEEDVRGTNTYVGIGAAYDLGGGASLVGGIVHADADFGGAANYDTVGDFGVAFRF